MYVWCLILLKYFLAYLRTGCLSGFLYFEICICTPLYDLAANVLKAFDMHKYSEFKNNLFRARAFENNLKLFTSNHCALLALGFRRFAERRKLFTCYLCAQFDWSTDGGQVAASHFYLCQMPLKQIEILPFDQVEFC